MSYRMRLFLPPSPDNATLFSKEDPLEMHTASSTVKIAPINRNGRQKVSLPERVNTPQAVYGGLPKTEGFSSSRDVALDRGEVHRRLPVPEHPCALRCAVLALLKTKQQGKG